MYNHRFLRIGLSFLGLLLLPVTLFAQSEEGLELKKPYKTSISYEKRQRLPREIKGSSGLIYWNKQFWTHNDKYGSNVLFAFGADNPESYSKTFLENISLVNWEAIAQDEDYLYLGDFGNHSDTRTDLKVIRVNKKAYLNHVLIADTISFSYGNQIDFTEVSLRNAEYDCEAFVVTGDSIYLFTKSWKSKTTSIFAMPKTPGYHFAKYVATYPLGLVTDAVYIESRKMLILCGYSKSFLRQFLYVFCNSEPPNFFQGNKYDITLRFNLLPHQIEGVESIDGDTIYVTNEHRFISPARIHSFVMPKEIALDCGPTLPDSTGNLLPRGVNFNDSISVEGPKLHALPDSIIDRLKRVE